MRRIASPLRYIILLSILFIFPLAGCSNSSVSSNGQVTVHVGYFPNLTHAVALVGVARGTFAKALGSQVHLETTTFNAGPSLIEALFANSIDIGYVGPNPAVNGYIKSNGSALRIIAGASSGGVEFVVRPGANIQQPSDLANKKLATPQLGGTQDVSLRYYLQQHGLKTADKGGNVQVIPTDNATILTLFKQGKIDGAWVPEPWATRLVAEDGGKVFLDERSLWPNNQFATTVVVVRKAFADEHPDLVKKFLQAHVETVEYIVKNQTSAESIANSEIKRITGKSALPTKELGQAFSNLDVTYDPLVSSISRASNEAYTLGFLGQKKPDLMNIYSLDNLNAVLSSQGLNPVKGS